MKYVSGVVALCMVIGLAACAKGPVISLEKNELATSATSLKVLVANPVKGTDQSQKRYWVCLAKAGTPDSEWGDWSFVYDNMTAIDLAIKRTSLTESSPPGTTRSASIASIPPNRTISSRASRSRSSSAAHLHTLARIAYANDGPRGRRFVLRLMG